MGATALTFIRGEKFAENFKLPGKLKNFDFSL